MKLNRSHSIITEAATWRTKMRWRENIWRNHEKTKTRKKREDVCQNIMQIRIVHVFVNME
jgi:hypothetical protein